MVNLGTGVSCCPERGVKTKAVFRLLSTLVLNHLGRFKTSYHGLVAHRMRPVDQLEQQLENSLSQNM